MTSKTTTDTEVPLAVLRRQRLSRLLSRLRLELAEIELALTANRFGHLLAFTLQPEKIEGFPSLRRIVLSSQGRVVSRPDWWNHRHLTLERGMHPLDDRLFVGQAMPARVPITQLLRDEYAYRKQLLQEMQT